MFSANCFPQLIFTKFYFFLLSDCGGTLRGENGTILSPNYPNEYNSNAECHWLIEVSFSDTSFQWWLKISGERTREEGHVKITHCSHSWYQKSGVLLICVKKYELDSLLNQPLLFHYDYFFDMFVWYCMYFHSNFTKKLTLIGSIQLLKTDLPRLSFGIWVRRPWPSSIRTRKSGTNVSGIILHLFIQPKVKSLFLS
jgi:hypothetical protein